MHKNLNKFLQAVAFFPVLTASFAVGPLPGVIAGSPLAAVISPDQTRTLSSETAGNQQSDLDKKAAKVDAFFAKYGRPAEGHGRELVEAAIKNGQPPFAIAAIVQVESSGYAHACPNDLENGMGYNSCHGTNFSSVGEAISVVAATMSGNNPKTAKYYAGKDFETRLEVYNGRANGDYVDNVMWVMDQIEKMPIEVQTASASAQPKA